MLNQTAVFQLIQQLGGNNNNIIYNVTFVDYCGGCHASAMMLSQLLYWSDKTRLEGGWMAKTKEDWFKELRLSPYQMRKAEAKFGPEGFGFLEIEVRKFRGFPTNHYRLHQETFVSSFVKFFEERSSKNFTNQDTQETSATILKKVKEPYTETTYAETTTEPTLQHGGGASGSRRGSKKIVFEEMEEGLTHERPTKAPQTGREIPAAEKCPVFKEAQAVFEAAYLSRTGTAYRFAGGKDGQALKAVLTHLKTKVAPEQDWATALHLFTAIVQGWDNLPKWYADKFQLNIINSQLNGILTNISQLLNGIGNSNISGADW